ncbi:MAG: hypothetical protein NNA21_03675 [Nitrospira sp.]|nr:hypothetical protein [Nitrospira sp.]
MTQRLGNPSLIEIGFPRPRTGLDDVLSLGASPFLMANITRRSVDLPKAAIEALRRGDLIGAITAVRRERQIGFKEAKELVEAYVASQPALKKKMEKVVADAQRKFIRWMIGFAIVAAGIALVVAWKISTSQG